jgi:hypothetical protein
MGRSVADLPAVCLAGSGTKREISQVNPIYARIEHPDALSSYSLTLLYAYTPTLFYLLASTPVEYPLQITLLSCKTNPISKAPKISATSVHRKSYQNKAAFRTDENEPKRTQNEPNFSPVRGTQSQNEPKQTQNEPNFRKPKKSTQPQFPQRIMKMKTHSDSKKQTQTNPIRRGAALLPRRSPLRSRVGEAGTNPNKSAYGGQLPGLTRICHTL